MGIEEIRNLEKICEIVDFHIICLGNVYCRLKPNKKINCRFRAPCKDENGIYPCLNLKWYPKENCHEA